MPAENHAVCVAINDKDRAWYEMLVPFILSLRQSGYPGRIVVIGFGLSQRKSDILRGQSIEVVEASSETALPIGRFLEVAKLCQRDPSLIAAALYDADIWFSGGVFDLFSHVDGDALFACADAFFCDFVSDPLIGPNQPHLFKQVTYEVAHRYGCALQAGLVAGTAAAWRDFGDHLRHCIEGIGTDFRETYGLDTCFLHLWGAKGRVVLLPEIQNFVPKKGLAEGRDRFGQTVFKSGSTAIRGLHMTTDIRFLNAWRYYTNHSDRALREGQPFALKPENFVALADLPRDIAALMEEAGFELVAMASEEGTVWRAFHDPEGLTIVATGNHEIVLRTIRRFDPLVLTAMTMSGIPGPVRARIGIFGREVGIGRDLSQWVSTTISPGQEIRLSGESLPGQMCRSVWILSERHALVQ